MSALTNTLLFEPYAPAVANGILHKELTQRSLFAHGPLGKSPYTPIVDEKPLVQNTFSQVRCRFVK